MIVLGNLKTLDCPKSKKLKTKHIPQNKNTLSPLLFTIFTNNPLKNRVIHYFTLL